MQPPRLDAGQVIVVEIAWPPGDLGKLTCKFDDVLAGAAAGLNGIPGFAGKEPREHRADRLMVAMEGRRVEPPICLEATAILAEFNHIIGHDLPPGIGATRVVRR